MSRRKPYDFGPENAEGPSVWRSLEDRHRDPAERRAQAEAEMPGGFVRASGLVSAASLGRRSFLGVTGAAAAAGLSACVRRPVENILPFTEGPEYVVPGVPLHFATVTERRGEAVGLLVTSHEGRPTKIEGNPEHPGSLGATDAFAQASVLELYDPHRSTGPARREGNSLVDATPKEADSALGEVLRQHRSDGGRGLRVLARPTNSPTFLRMRAAVKRHLPSARFHTYAPVHESQAIEGARLAYGRPLRVLPDLARAQTVLALDSDFLGSEAGAVRNARSFGMRRRPRSPSEGMNRLYAVEGTFSVTGAHADHRLRLPSSDVGRYLIALARELASAHGLAVPELAGTVARADAEGIPEAWIREVASELARNKGRAPILVGSRQPAWVHAVAHGLNQALGNTGRTVHFFDVADPEEPEQVGDLQALVADLEAGRVSTLVILGGNPAYDAPGDLGVVDALAKEGLTSIHLSSHRDETSQLCSWHVPRTHELEAWGDQRSLDGTVAVQQPLIAPLYPGARSDIELLAVLAGEKNTRGHHLVRATAKAMAPESSTFERDWRRTLHRGRFGDRPAPVTDLVLQGDQVSAAAAQAASGRAAVGADNLEVIFAADPHTLDGQFANNPWMLEMPHPMTQVAWDNGAQLSAKTARALHVETGDVLRLSREGAKDIEIAVVVLPGHADWCVTLPLGWGRTAGIKYGAGAGFDVQPLRTTDGFFFATGVRATKANRRHGMAILQEHGAMEGRPIAVDATLEKVRADDPRYRGMPAYAEEPEFAQYRSVLPTTGPLWKQVDYSDQIRWGMTIDLSACTGCNACVVACQAENNVPAVGKQQAAIGRAMHWLRLDRYFVGDDEDEPLIAMQPLGCQQCEEAPCENVCPVNATTHSPEGLNDMAYNRCIGTRYCMNNCPYKVRRFNYLNWNGHIDKVASGMDGMYGDVPETVQMQKNPNVTVRFRGVMEKCTYCVQRIQEARIAARRDERPLKGSDVVTACQQACPSEAITFGDLNDTASAVAQSAALDRHYKLLAAIGTRPRTTYLGKIRNPNPALLTKSGAKEAG